MVIELNSKITAPIKIVTSMLTKALENNGVSFDTDSPTKDSRG